jgi:hypothetical protein
VNIYIAGRGDAQGIIRYRAFAALVLAAGHRITYDWTIDVEAERAQGVHDDMLTREQRRGYAQKDFQGVLDADVFVYLTPHEKSEGAAYELGAHHMKRDLIKTLMGMGGMHVLGALLPCVSIVVGDAPCLFASRSDFFVDTEDEALALLPEIAKSDNTPAVLMSAMLTKKR